MQLKTLNPFDQARHTIHSDQTPDEVMRRLETHDHLECRLISNSSRTPAASTRFIARMTRDTGGEFPWMAEGTLRREPDGTVVTIVTSRTVVGVLGGCAYWLVSIVGAIVAFAAGEMSIAVVVLIVGLALSLLELRQSAPGGPALVEAIMETANSSDGLVPETTSHQ